MPRVSVIMPAYNCEAVLEEAVRSIYAQSYSDWELIICDDRSGDGTYALARRLAEGRDNVTVLQNPVNSGSGIARNRGIEAARGEFIALMDADDIALPGRIAAQVDYLDRHPEHALVGTWADIFNRDGVYSVLTAPEAPDARAFRHGAPFANATLVLRKSMLDQTGYFKGRDEVARAEDFELLVRIYAAGFRGGNLQAVHYLYRLEDEDYKKRKLSHRLFNVKLRKQCFDLLGFPKRDYIYILRPLLYALVPPVLQRRLSAWRSKPGRASEEMRIPPAR